MWWWMHRQTKTRNPTVELRILGNPSGILSRRKEEPHSDKQKDQDLTERQGAIKHQAA